MLNNPGQLRGFIIALVIGIGFIVIVVSLADSESTALVGQLTATVALVFILIGLAALIAWLCRRLIQKIQKPKR